MSAFGTVDSQKAGEGSLGSFIVAKALQSRKDAKAEKEKQQKILDEGGEVEEKDKKNLFGKALLHNFGGGAITGNKKFSQNFQYKKPQEESTTSSPRPKIGDGLRKILVTGFGSLLTDTERIQGGLSATTEILNQQIMMQGMSASSLGSIQSILANQTENQVSLIESLTSQPRGGGGGDQANSFFGGAKSQGAGEGSILSFMKEQVEKALQTAMQTLAPGVAGGILSRIPAPLLLNPWTLTIAGAAILAAITSESLKNKGKMSGDSLNGDPEKDKAIRTQLAPTLGGTSEVSHPSYLPMGDPRRWLYDNPGKPIPPNIQSQIDGMPKAGPWQNFAAGGVNSMIGEAGKEAVVDLNSADARNQMKNKGGIDPSMKAVGGSLLAVTDAFIKSLGPAGAPVAQTVGGEISNLANTFGMSSTLPNLRVGGGLFGNESGSKRERTNFLKELVKGSLEYLGAKKPEEKTAAPSAAGAAGPGASSSQSVKDKEQETAEQAMDVIGGSVSKTVTNADGREQTIIESKEKILGTDYMTRRVDENGILPGGEVNASVTGPGAAYRPVQGTNGTRWYDNMGKIYTWQKGTTVKELKYDQLKEGYNNKPYIRESPETGGHVFVNKDSWTMGGKFQDPPVEGMYHYEWGKKWAEDQTGKLGWQPYEKEQGTYGGTSTLPPAQNVKFESGGTVTVNGQKIKVDKNGYPDHDGYFNPLGFGSGIPNPFVSNESRSNLATQRETARNNSGFGRGMQVMRGERLLTGGTPADLQRIQNPYRYASGGSVKVTKPPKVSYEQGGRAVQKPWWDVLGWATGAKEVQKGTTGIYSNSPMGKIGEAAAQRNKMMKEMGYERGGSAQMPTQPPRPSMFGTVGDELSTEEKFINIGRQLEELQNYMIISLSKIEMSKNQSSNVTPGVRPVGATSEQDTNPSIVFLPAPPPSGGSGMINPVSPGSSASNSADSRRIPDPGGDFGYIGGGK